MKRKILSLVALVAVATMGWFTVSQTNQNHDSSLLSRNVEALTVDESIPDPNPQERRCFQQYHIAVGNELSISLTICRDNCPLEFLTSCSDPTTCR